MGILYQAADPLYWVIWLFILFALMAFNELGRTSLWAGIALFAVVPIVLTVFVWPITAAPGNEYGTGTWFNWVKTYSALAGCLGFMALRFVKWRGADGTTHHLYEKRWALCFPPLILAVNIAEAVVRDFQVFSFGLWQGGVVENLWTMSGPWNIMNGIAGILNIVTICGWFGIFISKDSSKDMIWPDMIWRGSSPTTCGTSPIRTTASPTTRPTPASRCCWRALSPRSSSRRAPGCSIARRRWRCGSCS